MTPEIETLKMQISDLKLEKQFAEFDNKLLYAENKRLFWVFSVFMIVFFVLMLMFAAFTAKKYDLGNAVLNSGICVEESNGFVCETPDNTTFIAK